MAVEEVKAYKTSDGKMFTNPNEAATHEREIVLRAKIEEFVDRHYFSGVTRSDVSDILIENSDELIKILKGK